MIHEKKERILRKNYMVLIGKTIKIWPILCHADLFYKFTRKRMILVVKMSKAFKHMTPSSRLRAFSCALFSFHCFHSNYEQRMRALRGLSRLSAYQLIIPVTRLNFKFFVSWGAQESLLKPELTGVLSDKNEDYRGDYIFFPSEEKRRIHRKNPDVFFLLLLLLRTIFWPNQQVAPIF